MGKGGEERREEGKVGERRAEYGKEWGRVRPPKIY